MFTDQEIRLTLGLAACFAALGLIYFAAWVGERFRKKDVENDIDGQP